MICAVPTTFMLGLSRLCHHGCVDCALRVMCSVLCYPCCSAVLCAVPCPGAPRDFMPCCDVLTGGILYLTQQQLAVLGMR
jgi:hypothetical protein